MKNKLLLNPIIKQDQYINCTISLLNELYNNNVFMFVYFSAQFPCLSGEEISLYLKCDNTRHCKDASDEYNCPGKIIIVLLQIYSDNNVEAQFQYRMGKNLNLLNTSL